MITALYNTACTRAKKLCLPKMLPTKLDARVSALLRGSRGALCCAGVCASMITIHQSPHPELAPAAGAAAGSNGAVSLPLPLPKKKLALTCRGGTALSMSV